MKKFIALLLALMTVIACAACTGGQPAEDENLKTDIALTERYQLQSMDYVTTALAEDHYFNANFVDGLLENDSYGNLVPSIAESYESNEDATVWTFHLRKGVQWVTNTEEEYAEVKAQDFVTGARHGVEFGSGTAWLLETMIEGYADYEYNSDFSDEAWDKVGIKALDDYTVQFTMMDPVPYFASVTTYAVLYPVNQEFLESKGTGCKLGAPDPENCAFGTTEANSILYNGAFILDAYDLASQTVMVKNHKYWDPENVHLDKITVVYVTGDDPYETINGFEQGLYIGAGLSALWEDYDEYVAKYEGYTHITLPEVSCYGVVFNYNRESFEYTSPDHDKQATHDAMINPNFRKAFRAAFDRQSYLETTMVPELATSVLRNINNFAGAGTSSDGTPYFAQVTAAYNEMTGENRDLGDACDPFYSPEEAMKYIEAAKADGIQFPIHLDMMVQDNSVGGIAQGQSMKASVEENTQGNIIVDLQAVPRETILNVCYYNTDHAASDYDITTFTGWGPDYADPKSYVDIYSSTSGYYLTTMGLTSTTDEDYGDDADIKTAAGFDEYEKAYRDADAITDDLDARYAAFAKADATLVANCLYIPVYSGSRNLAVGYTVPFTQQYSETGVGEYKFKGMKVQTEMVTTEQYDAAYNKFMGID